MIRWVLPEHLRFYAKHDPPPFMVTPDGKAKHLPDNLAERAAVRIMGVTPADLAVPFQKMTLKPTDAMPIITCRRHQFDGGPWRLTCFIPDGMPGEVAIPIAELQLLRHILPAANKFLAQQRRNFRAASWLWLNREAA